MKQVLLDTNFILTCVKQKIDFFEDIKFMGMEILIPQQVIGEIQKLNDPYSEISLSLLDKSEFKKIDIGKGHVDKNIVKFVAKNKGIIVATLDRELKDKIQGHKLVIRGKKRLEVVQ